MSKKIPLDKYYTPKDVAKHCTEKLVEFCGFENIHCIEPSCGNGAFIESIESNFSSYEFLDIAPEHTKVVVGDYLNYEHIDKGKNVVVLGNPPFGRTSELIRKFYNKSVEFSEYIAFILPISQLNNTKQLYKFDLIYSEDLGEKFYSGVILHCCFNIYKRPKNGKLNKKVKINIPNLEIVEYRRDKEDSYRKKVKDGYFHSICSWGSGSLGKTPRNVGQYSMELYFYSEDSDVIDLVKSVDWRKEISCISMKKLPKGLALEILQNKLRYNNENN